MKITQSEFAGMAPKLDRAMLAEDLAQESVNAGFEMGLLTGALVSAVPSPVFPELLPNIKSIAKPPSINAAFALSWGSRGGAFANMLAPSDSWGRVYYLARNGAKYQAWYTTNEHYVAEGLTTDPLSYSLGVPLPVGLPIVTGVAITRPPVAPGGDPVVLDMQKTAYCFTFVDAYGHEGAPSAPSHIVELPYDAPFAASITVPSQTLAGINMDGGVRRFYRASFDGSSSEWQYVADVAIYETSWSDTVPLGQEGEVMPSANWVGPTLMDDFAAVNGSFFAGSRDNVLMYSEYMLPHAWPESLRFPLPYAIVAIKATLGGLFIGTTGAPFWASGTDPAAAVPVNLGMNYPCIAADSVVDMGGWVIYASQDGLVSAEAGGVTLLSGEFVDRMRWLRDFNPAFIKAFGHEGDYYFSVNSTDWWVFNATEGRGLRKVTLANIAAGTPKHILYDAARDTTVVLAANGVAYDIVSQQDASLKLKWISKERRSNPTKFSTGQVVSTVYPVTLTVTADGVAEHYVAQNERPFRLKANGDHNRWTLGVEANALARISSFSICQSPSELIND